MKKRIETGVCVVLAVMFIGGFAYVGISEKKNSNEIVSESTIETTTESIETTEETIESTEEMGIVTTEEETEQSNEAKVETKESVRETKESNKTSSKVETTKTNNTKPTESKVVTTEPKKETTKEPETESSVKETEYTTECTTDGTIESTESYVIKTVYGSEDFYWNDLTDYVAEKEYDKEMCTRGLPDGCILVMNYLPDNGETCEIQCFLFESSKYAKSFYDTVVDMSEYTDVKLVNDNETILILGYGNTSQYIDSFITWLNR